MTKSKETVKHRLDEQHTYFEALGRFVQTFAETEIGIAMTLRTLAGVTKPVARAIFSGVRVETAMSFINRIMEVTSTSQPMRDDFQYAFTQLGHINQARNQILHYGVDLGFTSDGEYVLQASDMIVSNKGFALTEDRIRETPISGEILDNMIHDLDIISCILMAQNMRVIAARSNDDYSTHLLAEADRLMRARETAWRYKPVQPASRRGKRSLPFAPNGR